MPELRVIEIGKKKSEFKPKCTVQLTNAHVTYTDFVVVGIDENTGEASLMQYADVVTLGFAVQMMAEAFRESYESLTAEEKVLADSVLQTVVCGCEEV